MGVGRMVEVGTGEGRVYVQACTCIYVYYVHLL